MHTILETTPKTKRLSKMLVTCVAIMFVLSFSNLIYLVKYPISDSFTHTLVLTFLDIVCLCAAYLGWKIALPLSTGDIQLEEWVELQANNPRHHQILKDYLQMALHKEDFQTAAVLRDILAQKQPN